jgi:hypothetical protein
LQLTAERKGRKDGSSSFRTFRNQSVEVGRTISSPRPGFNRQIVEPSAIFASFAVKRLG